MRASGCWLSRRDRLGIALEQILVEVLVRIETLRHLADRRVGLVQVDHLLAQGLEVGCATASWIWALSISLRRPARVLISRFTRPSTSLISAWR